MRDTTLSVLRKKRASAAVRCKRQGQLELQKDSQDLELSLRQVSIVVPEQVTPLSGNFPACLEAHCRPKFNVSRLRRHLEPTSSV